MMYVKLFALFIYCKSIMYTIKLGNQIIKQTNNHNAAWASYRSFARDFVNKQHEVTLLDDDTLLHQKKAGLMLLDDVNSTTTNDLLKVVLSTLDIDNKKLKSLVADSELDVSNSRIDGWTRRIDDRKYTDMHNDELAIVLELVLSDLQSSIKSPKNIVKARKKLELTQEQLAEKLGLKSGFRQVARWESGEQEMPDSRWKKMQEFLK